MSRVTEAVDGKLELFECGPPLGWIKWFSLLGTSGNWLWTTVIADDVTGGEVDLS